MPSEAYYIGVDVGTGSARAALVDTDGNILSESTYATKTFRDDRDHRVFEQSTTDIWNAISKACRDVVRDAKVKPEQVRGVGFDATCSLAVTDLNGEPMSVTEGHWGPGEKNIILWADHRAEDEAKKINSTGSVVLNYVGKTMSLEMEIPKVLWLKKHMASEHFKNSMFFDLPDFLSFRATGNLARSNCSLACKCSYVPPGVGSADNKTGWQADFFKAIGLDEFVENDFKQLGGIPGKNGIVLTAGEPVGKGLSKKAAEELGLVEGTPVGSAVIDAYAGWIGTVAAPAINAKEGAGQKLDLITSQHRLAAIAGTSTCHIVQSPEGILVEGVWGPYKHAVFPGFWMNEGGQSSTGQLIEFMVETHASWPRLKARAEKEGKNHFVVLSEILEELRAKKNVRSLSHLTRELYIYPDLHGNRSPLADNSMRGMITGLHLDSGMTDLALKYHATLEAIALQTRHIMDEMNRKGHKINSIYMSGGQVKNAALMQLIADACGVPVQLPFSHSASVVAGSAILGRFAEEISSRAGGQRVYIETQTEAEKLSYANRDRLWELMTLMTKPGKFVYPTEDAETKALLNAKWKIFHDSIDFQKKAREKVADALAPFDRN